MAANLPIGVSPTLLTPTPAATAADLAKRGQIKETAKNFEASFLSIMLQQMFEGVETAPPFGGGPGVPEAYRERIFEAFFRLPGHAEREGGVGLGLSLVRQITERHGGRVRCEARDGGGSCFVLELPG